MNVNQNQQTIQQPTRIEVDQIPFDGLLKSKLTTTINIAKSINSIFRAAIPDFEGSIVAPDQNGFLQTALFFRDRGPVGKDQIKAVKPIVQTGLNASGIDRINSLNARYSSRKFDLTNEAKEVLLPFIYVQNRNKKIDWNKYVFDQIDQSYNGYQIYTKVVGIDLVKILREIYGGKNNGSKVDYNISIVRPMGSIDMAGATHNFLVNIQQLDTEEVEKLATEIGLVAVQGSIHMVR